MNLTTTTPSRIAAMSQESIAKVGALQSALLQMDQEQLVTQHVIHAGMYARTIMLPKDTVLTGALIKIPTTIIVHGDAAVYTGESTVHLVGYHVIPASAGRKQVFRAFEDTNITMIFPSNAKTVEEAEQQFTDEYELLLSHRQPENNLIIITGE